MRWYFPRGGGVPAALIKAESLSHKDQTLLPLTQRRAAWSANHGVCPPHPLPTEEVLHDA